MDGQSKMLAFQTSTNIGKYHESVYSSNFMQVCCISFEAITYVLLSFKFALYFHQRNMSKLIFTRSSLFLTCKINLTKRFL